MRRIIGSVSLGSIALMFTGCCGPNDPNCRNVSIGPSTGEIVAVAVGIVAAVGVTTAVVIEVEHSHHNIKGCIFNSPDGLEIQDAGTHKKFMLTGATLGLKEGNLVRIHGSRAKKQKESKTDQVFVVQSLKKTYGACTVTP
jgi:hypothetical protein